MRNRSLAALAIAGGAALAACNSGGSALAPVSTTTQTNPARAFTPGHLYVASQEIVYRYRLNADGFASTKPDGKLDLDYPAAGIAIGPDGDLYVAGDDEVVIFKPGASAHAKPSRVLYVSEQPVWLAVDQRGYLDVNTYANASSATTYVYAPKASGHDAPINTILEDHVTALGASHGIVYIEAALAVYGVHERPAARNSSIFSINYPQAGVATDSEHLYAQDTYEQGSKKRYPTWYLETDEFTLDPPGSPIRTIVDADCAYESSSYGVAGYGLAVYKKYLYEGCFSGTGPYGQVFVYDRTKSGRQRSLERISGGLGIAIGP